MTFPVEVVKGKDKLGRLDPQGRLKHHYSPSEITLYGMLLEGIDASIGPQNATVQTMVVIQTANLDNYYPSLIYAFAYQGHCYNLPEPVILIVRGMGVPAEGFDYEIWDRTQNPPVNVTEYKMWKVDKLDRSLQLETTMDTFEEIVLKRALAGTKQPMSYASHAQLSHRGGKLSE
jgi:hypothetical protein